MKKSIALLLFFSLMFSLAACGGAGNEAPDPVPSRPSPSESVPADKTDAPSGPSDPSDPETDLSESGAKSLVVYFSWSGNTENVAKSLQSQTGAGLFEIIPATPYTEDYNTP